MEKISILTVSLIQEMMLWRSFSPLDAVRMRGFLWYLREWRKVKFVITYLNNKISTPKIARYKHKICDINLYEIFRHSYANFSLFIFIHIQGGVAGIFIAKMTNQQLWSKSSITGESFPIFRRIFNYEYTCWNVRKCVL